LNDARLIPLGFAAAGLLAGLAWFVLLRREISPEEREKRRRLAVSDKRRTLDAYLTEAQPGILHYRYEFRGIEYFASQDVTAIQGLLPAEPERLIGPVSVRFDPNNPANSIVVCEEWSGLPATVDESVTEMQREESKCS
jgi:hypothetical protein